MKVTIRGVDKKLWEEVQIEREQSNFHPPQKSNGEIVNEGLRLRKLIKSDDKARKLLKAMEEAKEEGK